MKPNKNRKQIRIIFIDKNDIQKEEIVWSNNIMRACQYILDYYNAKKIICYDYIKNENEN